MTVRELVKKQTEVNDTISDMDLVRRFKDGDESAFSTIVLKYQNRLFRVALGILGDEDTAMDIAQDAFVKAYGHLMKFREDSGLYTWLYRILYNLCISHLRRKKIVSFLSFDDDDESREFVSNLPDPEENFERKEIKNRINEALEKLPERQRSVFIMKQIEGLKHEEIASITGITEGAVKASYFQAVQKLRNHLKEYGDRYGL